MLASSRLVLWARTKEHRWLDFAPAVLLAGLCGALIAIFPLVYWNDGVDRMAHRDDLLVWRWLPALQSVIWLVTRVTQVPEIVRSAFGVVAVLAVIAATKFGRRALGALAGRIGGLGVATSSVFLVLATQPYQEVLFLGAVFLCFERLSAADGARDDRQRRRARIHAGLWCMLAAATRYEGWLLVGLVVADASIVSFRRSGVGGALRAAAGATFYSGGPIIAAWLAFGPFAVMSREATIGAHLAPSALLSEVRQFVDLLQQELLLVPFGLGIFGLLGALRGRTERRTHIRIVAFLALGAAIMLAIEPLPSARRTIVPAMLLMPYAGHALVMIARSLAQSTALPSSARRVIGLVLTCMVFAGAALMAHEGFTRVQRYNRAPDLRKWRVTGAWLEAHRDRLGCILAESEGARRYLVIYSSFPMSMVVDARHAQSDPQKAVERALASGLGTAIVRGREVDGLLETRIGAILERARKEDWIVVEESLGDSTAAAVRIWLIEPRQSRAVHAKREGAVR